MPNILKRFSLPKFKPYEFPDAEGLETKSVVEEQKSLETLALESEIKELVEVARLESEQEQAVAEEPAQEAEIPFSPIAFAQVQADHILEDAHRQAEEILENARREAEEKANELYAAIRQDAYEAGHAEGVQRGIAQALEENTRLQEEQAQELGKDVQKFLEQASAALDQQMDENLGQLRDLAVAIAEKIVCVSLKSSESVIARMIQSAIDKRKRREWVHIYIAECDAKSLAQIPASLTASLTALSDRVRIIPISDDESGTCIIEMPDEIIDASASTQMSNIRAMLLDRPIK